MAKDDVVKQGVSDLQAAELQAQSDFVAAFYDKVVADQPVQSGGGFSQADLDAKSAADVAAAVAPLNDQIASIQAALSGETSKEQDEAGQLASAKASLDAIKAILFPPVAS